MCDGIFWRFHFITKQSVTILWYDVGKYNDENLNVKFQLEDINHSSYSKISLPCTYETIEIRAFKNR